MISGGCHCTNIRFEFTLTRAPETYNPRACDCAFCTKHAAAWLSDPAGALSLRIKDEARVSRYRQGSGQAEFLVCAQCGVLAAVFHRSGANLHAAVNAKAVEGGIEFGPEQTVSPKKLAPGDKARRWQEVWFSKVSIGSGDA